MHSQIGPQLRDCGKPIQRPGYTEKTSKAGQGDTGRLLDPTAQKMLARQTLELEVDRVLARCQISSRRDQR